MDKNKYDIIRLRMEKTAAALRKNNMYAQCVDSIDEILDVVGELINTKDIVAVGGSMTLVECGLLEYLRSGDYEFLDRYKNGLTKEEISDIYRKSFSVDVFFTSSNAITENGELFNVDGIGNRVAAMVYGPRSVIVIAGYNKIVTNLDEAVQRVKTIVAPANAKRLNIQTPCAKIGYCTDCNCESRICSSSVIISHQREKERIKVILVGEELGY